MANDGAAGVTPIDTKVAALTVRVVEPDTPPTVAAMTLVPGATPVARPALVIVATLVVADVHVAVAVMSCFEPSENTPVAANCCVVPATMPGVVGVTSMEVMVVPVTVSVVVPEMLPEVAVMVVVPPPTAVARPVVLMDAVAVVDELQVTSAEISSLLPSLKIPVAEN